MSCQACRSGAARQRNKEGIKQLVVPAGGQVGGNQTLALIGWPEEPLPERWAIESIPAFGTGAFMSRRRACLRILRLTMFCAGLLLALQLWISALLNGEGGTPGGLLLALLRRVLSLTRIFYPIHWDVVGERRGEAQPSPHHSGMLDSYRSEDRNSDRGEAGGKHRNHLRRSPSISRPMRWAHLDLFLEKYLGQK